MSILYSLCAAAYDACTPEVSEKRDDLVMSRVADYIRDYFQSDMSLCSMAKDLGYNTCYLSDFINKNFGTHFRTLLNSYRIDHAMTLLRTTDLPITEIAGRCGFSTIRSFNRAFCKINGISPREVSKVLGKETSPDRLGTHL